ncbi:MAG: endonuclease domain-containing protein [Pseudoxanthomonas sp.]|nr:endonuclease domain-containing protein [Pseudoxanthomonas sp.]
MIIKPPLPTTTLEYSRRLRREMTDAERKLWQRLRGSQLDGFKFRRQHPVPPYVADFCCVEKKLIVELDGSQHNEQKDAARTRLLVSQGWKVLRFWDSEALMHTEAVIEAIWIALGNRTLTPTPLPAGEGLQAR